MPLKLSLKPGEKFVVNGAVVMNGDRRATLVLQNKASILRDKDIMQVDDATSPARRVYFPVMMLYVDGGANNAYYDEFVLRMNEFMGVIRNPSVLQDCVQISRDVMAGEYYRALIRCRKLIEYEAERLGHVGSGLPGSSSASGESEGN